MWALTAVRSTWLLLPRLHALLLPLAACVVGRTLDGERAEYVADLCVGADGASSRVRQSLPDGWFERWSNSPPGKRFRLRG